MTARRREIPPARLPCSSTKVLMRQAFGNGFRNRCVSGQIPGGNGRSDTGFHPGDQDHAAPGGGKINNCFPAIYVTGIDQLGGPLAPTRGIPKAPGFRGSSQPCRKAGPLSSCIPTPLAIRTSRRARLRTPHRASFAARSSNVITSRLNQTRRAAGISNKGRSDSLGHRRQILLT